MDSGSAYAAVYLAPASSGWPVDVGDDPSFQASNVRGHLDRRLTWGVCRPDLRNRVRPWDLVIFFAAQDGAPHSLRTYRLSGWAVVDELVSQTDVWTEERLREFRSYSNLLIRPSAESLNFEHFEVSDPHPDWLWRIANPGRDAPRKSRWTRAGSPQLVDGYIDVDGWRLRPAKNYVVFKPVGHGTTVLADPPVVASVAANGEVETWTDDELSASLRSLILKGSARKGLRTTNRQQAHRHMRVMGSPAELEAELQILREIYGLRMR